MGDFNFTVIMFEKKNIDHRPNAPCLPKSNQAQIG